MLTYNESVRYILRLEVLGMKFGLRNIRALLKELGNPQEAYRIIHVAGTNGKGSVCAMCSSVLEEAGISYGTFTSPHLKSFRERFVVNGRMIPKNDFAKLVARVKYCADVLRRKGISVTSFEFQTAMAFYYFKSRRIECAVIEVGLGGRLDATNACKADIAIITNIALEHTELLGNTIRKIAREKAGIIKSESVVFTAEKDQAALEVFRKRCRHIGAKLHQVSSEGVKTGLLGAHQALNSSLAYNAMLQFGIVDRVARRGIVKARWPGRLEFVSNRPKVLLDCAHNAAGMETLCSFLPSIERRKTIAVLGISRDKNVEEMVRMLLPHVDYFIATQSHQKPFPYKRLEKIVSDHKKPVKAIFPIRKAIRSALKAAKKDDLVLVSGSIFVIGEARPIFVKMPL